jgi:3-oxoacyl-[acyl-carrier protein] reductase
MLALNTINFLSLQGKTILVTGASSGIGKQTAVLLNQLGARVILVGRDRNKLHEINEQLTPLENIIWPIDLTDSVKLTSEYSNTISQTGPLNGLVCCAGIQTTLPINCLDTAKINEVMQVNLNSALLLTKLFRTKNNYYPHSSIVFLSSVAAFIGQAGLSIYSASKGALVALTKSLAVELARNTIRVNCILPGYVKTSMLDTAFKSMSAEQIKNLESKHLLGFGQPHDVANMIAFLLADTGRWITGSSFVIDGGYSATR